MIHRMLRPAAWLLAFHMLMLSGPYQSTWAAMISTDATIRNDRGQRAQVRLSHYLAREDVKALLESQGIDPREVSARMNSLTDAELAHIAETLDQLPAGGGFFETFVIILFLAFLILMITDLSGHTDVFPFVKKRAAGDSARNQAVVATSTRRQAGSRIAVAGINPDEALTVYFNPNSNDLTAKAYERLDGVALFMQKNPQARINIKGFSDSSGTASYDQMVSEIRANTVKNYLIAKGVEPSKISTAAGGSQGAAAGTGAAEKSPLNNRAVIEFK